MYIQTHKKLPWEMLPDGTKLPFWNYRKMNAHRSRHILWFELEIITLSPWVCVCVCVSEIDSFHVTWHSFQSKASPLVWFSYGIPEGIFYLWRYAAHNPDPTVRPGSCTFQARHLGKHSATLNKTCERSMPVLGAAFKMNGCASIQNKSPLSILLQSTKHPKSFNYSQ